MEKEDRRLLEQQGFIEDRSFFHSWSKDTERFSIFTDDKRVGYVSLTLMDEEGKGIRCQADLMIEVEGSENFDDCATVHLFTLYRKTVSDAVSSAYACLKSIGNGVMSSFGKCVI